MNLKTSSVKISKKRFITIKIIIYNYRRKRLI